MNISLFLGFPIGEDCDQILQEMMQDQRRVFVGDDTSYLKEITFEGNKYLGKSIGGPTNLSDLQLIETHIYSILQKLFPHHQCRCQPLQLFTFISPSI